jgi:hypothetical protein
MRFAAILLVLASATSYADGLNIRVMLSGQVVPGVYGQVTLGNDAPPPVVYAQPVVIEPQYATVAPIYLHVPPGHAKDWRKHCREYNACNRPVYFVRSQEYEPEYQRHYQEHERERAMARQQWEERERGHDHDHGHDHDDHGRGHDDHGHGHDDRDHDR